MRHPRDRELAFRALYDALRPELLRFVQRRAHPDHADDLVAEAFLVVWRRFDDVPAGSEEARAWIFGVTRNLLLNRQRGDVRRRALGVRLADAVAARPSVVDGDEQVDLVVSRVDLARAWHLLSEAQQEALALVAFEGLDAHHAAAVLDISPVAFRLRLSRARRALRLHLDHQPRPSRASGDLATRSTS